MRGRVGRRGQALFDDEGVDPVFGEQQRGRRSDRTRRSGPEMCSCHYPLALSSVSITPGTSVSRDPSSSPLTGPIQPAIAGVYI